MKQWNISISMDVFATLRKNINRKGASLTLLVMLFFTSCHPKTYEFEPPILYAITEHLIKNLASPFPPLSLEERETPWGQELMIGSHFAKDLDLYRAITSYKRALILFPSGSSNYLRKLQIEYGLLLSYYLGGKHREVIEVFEMSKLGSVPSTFPAFQDLLIILYDSYEKIGNQKNAEQILKLLKEIDEDSSNKLSLSEAILSADMSSIQDLYQKTDLSEKASQWWTTYHLGRKSIQKAQALNAILPGAGYLYVDQPKTAMTAFLLNSAFIAATYQLFKNRQPAAGCIFLSLELGWYLGGINGAGLQAKFYNERLYASLAKETMVKWKLFPVLMLNYSF